MGRPQPKEKPNARQPGTFRSGNGQQDNGTARGTAHPARPPRAMSRTPPVVSHKMLMYLLLACPITQHKLLLLRTHGLLRRLLKILTAWYRRREPALRAWSPPAKLLFGEGNQRRSPRP